jgi:cobalt transporter subunit CbtB
MDAIQAVGYPRVRTATLAGRWPAVATILIGLVTLYVIGFSSLPRTHNAAHDTRHAGGFPCH